MPLFAPGAKFPRYATAKALQNFWNKCDFCFLLKSNRLLHDSLDIHAQGTAGRVYDFWGRHMRIVEVCGHICRLTQNGLQAYMKAAEFMTKLATLLSKFQHIQSQNTSSWYGQEWNHFARALSLQINKLINIYIYIPGIDSCLMVTKWDFLEMEASLWLNGRSQNVAKGWLST